MKAAPRRSAFCLGSRALGNWRPQSESWSGCAFFQCVETTPISVTPSSAVSSKCSSKHQKTQGVQVP